MDDSSVIFIDYTEDEARLELTIHGLSDDVQSVHSLKSDSDSDYTPEPEKNASPYDNLINGKKSDSDKNDELSYNSNYDYIPEANKNSNFNDNHKLDCNYDVDFTPELNYIIQVDKNSEPEYIPPSSNYNLEPGYNDENELPPISFFGFQLSDRSVESKEPSPIPTLSPVIAITENKVQGRVNQTPVCQIFMTDEVNDLKKPVVYVDNSLLKVIDCAQVSSILTARGNVVSQVPGKEPDCVYCCYKADEGKLLSACILIMNPYEFLSQILMREDKTYHNFIDRVSSLKKKYGSLFILIVGLEGAVNKSMSNQNLAFRQLVIQEEPSRPVKRKYKKDKICEVDKILHGFGAKAKSTVQELTHYFELDVEVSVISCTNKSQVIEWISSVPKALIKRDKVMVDQKHFPDNIFFNVGHKKHKHKNATPSLEIRTILSWQLEQIDGVNEDMARAISHKYPTFTTLRKVLSESTSNPDKFLSTFDYHPKGTRSKSAGRKVGPLASRRIYKLLTCKNPEEFVD